MNAVVNASEISSILVSFAPVTMCKVCLQWKTQAQQCRGRILDQFATGFMLEEFDIDCFGVRNDNVRGRTGDLLEWRLGRLMRNLNQEAQNDELMRFWFRTHLHIHIMVASQPPDATGSMAVWEFVNMCLKHHGIFYPSQWLAARSLAESQQFFPFSILQLRHRVNVAKLADRAFVSARDMGCGRIGRSRFEVFDALIRVASLNPESYCGEQLCGCRTPVPSPDIRSRGDSDDSHHTSSSSGLFAQMQAAIDS